MGSPDIAWQSEKLASHDNVDSGRPMQNNIKDSCSDPWGLGLRSSLLDIFDLVGAGVGDAEAAARHPCVLRRLATGTTLFHEGMLADAIYFVRGGTFKTFATAEDGYEQVLAFPGRTEVLGFDALCTQHHPTAAVALEEASVYAIPIKDLFVLEGRIPELDSLIHRAASAALSNRDQLAYTLAAVASEVRLARFLLQWSQRMELNGHSPRRFVLPMKRRDIANHLGLAHETVSRSFGALAEWGHVQVNNREIEILDLAGLRAYTVGTRRPGEKPGRSALYAVASHRSLCTGT